MTSYGSAWQSNPRFATDFEQYLRDHAEETKKREELLCDFCIASVAHLSGARVVRTCLQPSVTTEGATYKTAGKRQQKCPATLLVPIASLALPECAVILVREHVHQRHANVAYADGRLRELTRLVESFERLQLAGVDINTLIQTGKRPHMAQGADDRDVAFLLRCRNDARAHFFNFAPADKNVAVVYGKLHASANERSSLREKLDAIRYIGERKTTRAARAAVNERNALGLELVRACDGQTIGHVELHVGLPPEHAKRAETMILGTYYGNSSGASWPLANKYQGQAFAFLGNDAAIDKRVAAYLLVSGILLGEFSTKTLKQIDWQAQCEAAMAENKALKETNSAQVQEIDALKAKFAKLNLLHPDVAAAL